MAFHLANKDGKYDDLVKNAEKYIKEVQWDAGEGHDESSMYYGGAGYGSHSRPDLSNTSFMIDTLKELGTSEDDAAIQRALVFVSRCQNLKSKYNDSEFADKNPDGGFYYTIAAGLEPSRRRTRWWPAELRFDDLRWSQEYDLRRREAR